MKTSAKLWLARNQNKIFGSIVILLVIVTLVWIAKPVNDKSGSSISDVVTSSNHLKTEERAYDFGRISMATGKVSHTFIVRNDGADPLVVKKLYTSCMCTTATMLRGAEKYGPFGMQGHGFVPSIDQTLASGESVDIEVTFDPAAHGPAGVGLIKRAVYLENNAGKPLELRFSALVTP